jgi:hypothetical protein
MSGPLIPQLRTYGLCESCKQPAHTDGEPLRNGGRGWIHTETDTYRCPPGQGGGFVQPMLSNLDEDKLDDAYHNGFDDGKSEGEDEGRAELAAEIGAEFAPHQRVSATNVFDVLHKMMEDAEAS